MREMRDVIERLLVRMKLSVLQQFFLGAGLTIALSMAVLAYVISARVAAPLTQHAAEETGFLISTIVGPMVQDLATSDTLSPEAVERLDKLWASPLNEKVPAIKIWLRDGTLVYATDKSMVGQKFPSSLIDAGFAGKISGEFNRLDQEENRSERELSVPLIEVYAPLLESGSKRVIAVGEFYEEARLLAAELRSIRMIAVVTVAAITAPMMLLIFAAAARASRLADTSRQELRKQIAETRALAEQNDELRKVAEDARLDSIRSNELLLQQVGQDIHDGPIQMISLLILKLTSSGGAMLAGVGDKDQSSGLAAAQDISARVLKELRDISTGLVLPELEGRTTEEVLWLAVREHEILSGTSVACGIENLPDGLSRSLKICLYRIVQEGLTNALHHAHGRGQRLEAKADGERLSLVISDSGRGKGRKAGVAKRSRIPLGIEGLRRRVALLQGSLDLVVTERGAELRASLPIVQL